jgi:hypothetical protein
VNPANAGPLPEAFSVDLDFQEVDDVELPRAATAA